MTTYRQFQRQIKKINQDNRKGHHLTAQKEVGEAVATQFQKCPNCRELIPVNDISNHIKIELLHPKWKERKEETKKRQSQKCLAEPQSISASLQRIAQHRPDLFVNEEEEEHEERLKRIQIQKQELLRESKKKRRKATYASTSGASGRRERSLSPESSKRSNFSRPRSRSPKRPLYY